MLPVCRFLGQWGLPPSEPLAPQAVTTTAVLGGQGHSRSGSCVLTRYQECDRPASVPAGSRSVGRVSTASSFTFVLVKACLRRYAPMAEFQEPVEEGGLSALSDRVAREPAPLQWIDFFWDVLQSGDCFCRHTNLRLYSDGLADFDAATSTTDSGDVWLFKGIALLGPSPDPHELFRIPQFNGPRMELTAHDYWVFRRRQTNPLIFPGQLFPIIHSAQIYFHC